MHVEEPQEIPPKYNIRIGRGVAYGANVSDSVASSFLLEGDVAHETRNFCHPSTHSAVCEWSGAYQPEVTRQGGVHQDMRCSGIHQSADLSHGGQSAFTPPASSI